MSDESVCRFAIIVTILYSILLCKMAVEKVELSPEIDFERD